MTEQPPSPSPAAQLRTLRIIWAALLIGPVIFLVVATTVGAEREPRDQTILFYVAAAMLVVITPVAHVLRSQVYARGRQPDGTVAAGAYATANIIFWAMFEGVSTFSIVGAMLNGGRGPHLYVTAVALAMHIVNFPTGRPMQGDGAGTLRPMDRR